MFRPRKLSAEDVESLAKYEEREVNSLADKCVHALLVLAQKRMPIKKEDLYKCLFKDKRNLQRSFNEILILANQRLIKIFGQRIYDLEDKKRFIIVSTKSTFADYVDLPDAIHDELGKLFIVLVSMFASPIEKVEEDRLIEVLHEDFELSADDAKSYIQTLVKRMYIEPESSNQGRKEYKWGPRAFAEVDIDEFFKKFLSLADYSENKWPNLAGKVETLRKIREMK